MTKEDRSKYKEAAKKGNLVINLNLKYRQGQI